MITRINEAKALTEHVFFSCDYSCKFDGRNSGVILGQNCIQLFDSVSMIYFFKNLFYQKQSKYDVNKGVVQIRGTLL